MNRIFTVLSAVLLSVSLWAQAPQQFSYQAVIRNSSNALVSSTAIGMKISLLQGSATGNAVYEETHTPTTNANGLVSIAIGGGTFVSGAFASVDWANGPYFVKTETDAAGGTNYSLTTTSQLLSVPYALHAKTAESIVGGGSGGSGFSHYIGEQFGGGVIFHLWKDAQGVEHGLVVATTDQSIAQAWSNITNLVIGQTAQSSWDGLSNSNAIVTQSGHTSSAAKLCLDLMSGAESDWYLPSIDELSLLWHSHFNVNKSLASIGGASVLPNPAYYWSSSEEGNYTTWGFDFSTGSISYGNSKSNTYFVRAVRAF